MLMRRNSNDSRNVSHFFPVVPPDAGAKKYYPAILVECKLKFRSLRASYHHSEERVYTAWFPELDLPVDWDRPAMILEPGTKFASVAIHELPKQEGNYYFTAERLEEMKDVLISRLVRKEKFQLLYNPVFKVYSNPDEQKEDFLGRVSDIALSELEPELRELTRRFELKLEQIREAEERKGRHEPLPEPDLIARIEKRSEILLSKSRLTTIFLNSAKAALKTKRFNGLATLPVDSVNSELQENLHHIEQEAYDAVNALCETFLERSTQCDDFEIGLQHQNVQVLRYGVLWVAY